MTVFILKLIAMVTMLTDHVGEVFCGDNIIMRSIGRCAFLIYAFLMAEGFRHLKDRPERMRQHFYKLGLLLLISEIPFDIFFSGVPDAPQSQSVMFTLLLGFAALALADHFKENRKIQALIYLAAAASTYFIRSNFKLMGVPLMIAFYYYLEKADALGLPKRMLHLLCIFLLYWPLYVWAYGKFCDWETYKTLMVTLGPWFITHLVMIIPLAFYNGKTGYRGKAFNTAYSWFYPAHFVILDIAKLLFL